MKISFRVSELESKYFFISNLSEWHFSCRASYNKEWLRTIGPLNEQEKRLLKEVAIIIREKLHYGRPFFLYKSDKSAWSEIQKKLPEKDYLVLRDAFKALDRYFQRLWKKDKPRLDRWSIKLQEAMQENRSKKLIRNMLRLFKPVKSPPGITVHLLFNPVKDSSTAGGANLGGSDITLEVPLQHAGDRWHLEAAIAIMAHEISHILLDNSKLPGIIRRELAGKRLPGLKYIAPSRPAQEIIQEGIIDAFVPSGYLAHKYLKSYSPFTRTFLVENLNAAFTAIDRFSNKRPINLHSLINHLRWRMYPAAVSYTETYRNLDRNFITQTIEILAGYPRL